MLVSLKDFGEEGAKLNYVTDDFTNYVGSVMRVISTNVTKVAHLANVMEIIEKEIQAQVERPVFGCDIHRALFQDELMDFLINTGFFWHAKMCNNQIKVDDKKENVKARKIQRIICVRTSLVRKSLRFIRKNKSKKLH
jgi:hypothetical protein